MSILPRGIAYADDLVVVATQTPRKTLQSDLNTINEWCMFHGMKVSIGKCSALFFGQLQKDNIYIEGQKLEVVSLKFLGVIFQRSLNFSRLIEYLVTKGNQMLAFLLQHKGLPARVVHVLIQCMLVPQLLYSCTVWSGIISERNWARLERIYRAALLMQTGCFRTTASNSSFTLTGDLSLKSSAFSYSAQTLLRMQQRDCLPLPLITGEDQHTVYGQQWSQVLSILDHPNAPRAQDPQPRQLHTAEAQHIKDYATALMIHWMEDQTGGSNLK